MESVAAAAVPLAQVGHLKLAATASSNFNNDDDDVELSVDLENFIDLEVMESSATTDVPLAKVGHQKLAAKASCSLVKFVKPLNDCTEADIEHTKQLTDAKSAKFAAENASSKVYMMASATEKQKRVTSQNMDVGI